MYTPQRKQFPATDRKGKAVAFADEITTPSPPKGLRDDRFGAASGSAVGDWRMFKHVGLLDEASLERKDLDALIEKNMKLEKELFDYQHNMGLLLIEKKKWTSTNEELQLAFHEANEILKRERMSNLIALSESEKREENLRKALISEKQLVAELERDLKYLQQEHSEMKSTSEAKLAEADALVMGIKEKALEVDRERAIAEEKLSVINRKSSELERKLKEVETREKMLQRERLSLATEREAHEAVFYKQREDLQEWEKKLTVEEDRLSEVKRSINHIEERTIESERIIKKKEKSLEEMQQKIDIAKSELKEREESIIIMLNDTSMKEKGFEAVKSKVDMKEKELRELEEKLTVREQMEIGKLLDDQKAVLDSRMQEFEKELEQRRMSFDEELEKRNGEIEKLQVEIGHKGEQLGKREAALEKMERGKEKEKDLEARLKAMKEKEKALKAEEKKLHKENERLLEDKESLCILKDEIEEIGAETTKQESRIREEYDSLRITKEDRLEFLRQQSEVKQQIGRVKQEEELLLKEREELKQAKGRFEKEWEALDEKKADISREPIEVAREKERFKISQISEKLRLKREEKTTRDNLKSELDDVKMQKELLEADMEIKKLVLHENAKNKASQLVENLEKQRRNLDMELQRQEREGEKDFNERARTYEKKSQEEVTENIDYVKKLSHEEMEELHYEKLALKREREAISVKKTQLGKLHDELYKGVDDLEALRIYLKEERDRLCRSQERFAVFLKEVDICDTCKIPFREFINSGRVPAVEHGDKLFEDNKSTSFIGILASAMVAESSQPDDSLDTMAGNDHEPSATDNSFAESKIQEAAEASLQPEIKGDKPRRGRDRSNSVRGRSQAIKAEISDSKQSNVEITRKRQREQASGNTESEHAAGDSDGDVDSITTGGCRKKRQTLIPVSLVPVQSRYYLRRHKNVGTKEDRAQASTGAMEKQESVNGDSRTVPSPKDNLTPPQGENRENRKAETLMEAVTHEEIVKVEEETKFKDKSTGKRPLEDPQLEAGGSGERKDHGEADDRHYSMIQEDNVEEIEEEEEEEEETDHPGEASIGKKIWVFFTT